MLVLSRKMGEDIVIGDHIVIRVLQINGRQVRIGLQAPVELPIRRGELAWAEAEKEPAGRPAPRELSKIPR